MPKPYQPDFKPLPDSPGFWNDDYLTNYGVAVVRHTDGKLYALGWAAEPVLVEAQRPIHTRNKSSDQDPNWNKPGWYGPLPVPASRRYEIRKLKEDFRNMGPT